MDFGKPNVSSANPLHSETAAGLVGLWLKEDSAAATFLVHSDFGSNPALNSYYGAPASVWLQLTVPRALPAAATISGALSIYGKTATRLPEGLYFRANASAGAGWRVGKLSSMVDPFDVVPGGNHHQHGFNKEVRALAADGSGAALSIASLDFSQAQFGRPIPLPAPVWANATSASEGASFLMIDNTWGVRALGALCPHEPQTNSPTPTCVNTTRPPTRAQLRRPTTPRGPPGGKARARCGGALK